MRYLLDQRDRWGNGYSVWIVVGMVFLIPISLWGLSALRLENEVRDWVPKANDDYKVVEWYRSHFLRDESVLLAIESSSLEDTRVERLVQKIRGTVDAKGTRRGGSKLIDRVQTPHDLIAEMRKDQIPYDEAVKRLAGVLVGSGPVRIQLSEFGRVRRDKVVEALRKTAAETMRLEVSVADANKAAAEEPAEQPIEPPAAGDADTSTGEAQSSGAMQPDAIRDSATPMPAHDLIVSWPGMHWDTARVSTFMELARSLTLTAPRSREPSPPVIDECFQIPGSPIALAIHLSEAGNADREAAFAWLIRAANQCGLAPDKVHMGGSAVLESALNREVLKSAWDANVPAWKIHRRSIMLLSGLVGGILAVWLLKSYRLAGLVLGVSYYTTIVSTSLVPLSGNSMNIVLIIMPTLILVTTLSVAIHLANYWQEAAARNLQGAIAEAVKTAFVPVLCAGLTMAIGHASLVTSSLAPVRDFGLYAMIGTLISLVVTLYGLPALLSIWPGRVSRPEPFESSVWHGLAAWIARRHAVVTVLSLAVAGGCMWGLKSFRTETRVISYFAEGTRTVADYEFIEQWLGGLIPVDVIVRFDRESQQQLKFLERRNLVHKIQSEIEKLPDVSGSLSLANFVPDLPAPGEGAHLREKARFSAASREVEDRVKSNAGSKTRSYLAIADDVSEFNAQGDELWRITAQAAILPQRNYHDLRAQIDKICSSILRSTSGNALEKVPPVGAQRSYHPGASHFVTGEIPLFLATQNGVMTSFLSSFAAAFATISLVVIVVLRNPFAGILAMIPNVLPIAAIFGLISWYQVPVDIGLTVTASIALGITINGTLHLITSFRRGIVQGKCRTESVGLALAHCGPAMWQTTLVVSIGLMMLYPADLILISRFGWVMAALLAAAFVSEAILMPALLAGPLGHLIERQLVPPALVEQAQPEPATQIEIPVMAAHEASIPGKPHLRKKSVRIRRAD
jgi:predicted RND superfamily exporter protein